MPVTTSAGVSSRRQFLTTHHGNYQSVMETLVINKEKHITRRDTRSAFQ
nr:transposase [Escherichia coli]